MVWWLFRRNQIATDRADANAKKALTQVAIVREALKGKKDIAVCEAFHAAQGQTLTQILETVNSTQADVKQMGERVANIEGRLNGNGKGKAHGG